MTRNFAPFQEKPIAHRGLHGPDIPENSLPAFEAAIAAGLAIELDVQQTADGTLMVFHDDTATRMTGADLAIQTATQAEVDTLTLTDGTSRIPTLAQVLAMVDGRAPLLIEIKPQRHQARQNQRIEPALAAELAFYAGPVAVQSFDHLAIRRLRRHLPEVPLGLLAGDLLNSGLWWPQRFVLKNYLLYPLTGADFIAAQVSRIDSLATRLLTWRGVPVLAWTVRDFASAWILSERRINVIFEGMDANALVRLMAYGR